MGRSLLLVVVLLLAGCGGDDAGDSSPTSPPATNATVATVPEDPARTPAECIELWNAFVRIGDAGQISAVDEFLKLVERGPVEAIVMFERSRCLMLVPQGSEEAVVFFAPDGRGPWADAGRADLSRLAPDALPKPNARGGRDGILTPIG